MERGYHFLIILSFFDWLMTRLPTNLAHKHALSKNNLFATQMQKL